MRPTLALLLALPALAAHPEPAPDRPVSARLIGDDKVTVEMGGRTVEEFHEHLKSGRPKPVPTGLKVRLTNTTKGTLELQLDNDVPPVRLRITGPGKVLVVKGRREKSKGVFVRLKPGEGHDVPLVRLSSKELTRANDWFPTKAGTHDITGAYPMIVHEVAPPGKPANTHATRHDIKLVPAKIEVTVK